MKHFTFDELTYSDKAIQLHIDNRPFDMSVYDNLTALVDNVLDPVRELWNSAIIVNSGYRCDALNKAVNGAKNSQHKYGKAADIRAKNKADNARLFELIKNSNIDFDQLIWEYGGRENPSWIHISFDKDKERQRHQVLYYF